MGNTCCISARSDDFLPEEDFRQNPSTTDSDFTNSVTTTQPEVNILSYNIFIRPPPIRTHDDDYKTERLLKFIKFLPQYDIVCLQELFLPFSCRRQFLTKAAKKAGLKYSCGSPKPNFFSTYFCDGGLITLSRFPILVSSFKPYPHGVGPDYLAQKGVLYCKVRIGDNILHLFSTHTQACYTLEPKYLAVLMDQLKHCRQFMDETLKKNGYKKEDLVIALGDFNVDGRRPIPFKADEVVDIYPPLREYPNLLKKEEFFEYDILESILSNDYKDDIQEPLLEQYEEHPVTFGDFIVTMNNQIKPKEEQLTYPGGLSSNRRLDYIFKITPKSLMEENQEDDLIVKTNLRFKSKSAGVEKFFVKGENFTQLSDHYGVRISLESQRRDLEKIPTGSTIDESFSPEETGIQS